jgi:hypothetical protein
MASTATRERTTSNTAIITVPEVEVAERQPQEIPDVFQEAMDTPRFPRVFGALWDAGHRSTVSLSSRPAIEASLGFKPVVAGSALQPEISQQSNCLPNTTWRLET